MPTVLYTCPGCGGELVYDPQSGGFTCKFCGNDYTKKQIEAMSAQSAPTQAQTQEQTNTAAGEGVVYSCPSCGAQIVTDATTAATFCYYCHSPVVLSGRLSDEWKPDKVMPFAIDKEQAVEKFIEWTSNKKYVPKSFFSPGQIDMMTGVYYPYWVADYEGDAWFNGSGTIVTRSESSTRVTTSTAYYDVSRSARVCFQRIMRNALGKVDMQLTNGIMPYPLGKLKPFSMPYLSGFMAEKRDVESADIQQGIERELQDYLQTLLTVEARYTTLTGSSGASYDRRNYTYVLLPAWVVTYRGRDNKTYYYAMNGQTGAICGRLPISAGKLLLHCGILFASIFAALCIGGLFLW